MRTPLVTAARGWIGTRFRHQGRLKKTAQHKGGVDCLGLLAGVAAELDLQHNGIRLAEFDRTDYGHFPDAERLQENLSRLMQPIALNEIQPGDVGLFLIDHNPQHLGIISDYTEGLGLIHAYAPTRAVVETRLDAQWRLRLHRAFRTI